MKALNILCLGMVMLFFSFGLLRSVHADACHRCAGDLNGDWRIDRMDAVIMEENFGTHNEIADVNNDTFVDIWDALVISMYYNQILYVLWA